MSISVPFTPDLEEKLKERAAAAGKDVSTFIREAVEEKLGLYASDASAHGSSEQWPLEFDQWMRDVATRASSCPQGFIVDDSRESIYEGRGE